VTRAEPPCCSVHAWICCRREVIDYTRLRGRICAKDYSWSFDNDVANVDSIWHHAGLHRVSRFPERYYHWGAIFTLEMDAG